MREQETNDCRIPPGVVFAFLLYCVCVHASIPPSPLLSREKEMLFLFSFFCRGKKKRNQEGKRGLLLYVENCRVGKRQKGQVCFEGVLFGFYGRKGRKAND